MNQINGPSLPTAHPQRRVDCEMAFQYEFLALVMRGEGAGWTRQEASAALLSLALGYFQICREPDVNRARTLAGQKKRAIGTTE